MRICSFKNNNSVFFNDVYVSLTLCICVLMILC